MNASSTTDAIWHGTTILTVRKAGRVVIAGDGQVSLGHIALVGLGAFITARLAPGGVTVPMLVLLAGVAGAALMTITGLPAMRVPGFTLSVVSLGLAVVAPTWLLRQEIIGTDRPNAVTFDAPLLPRGLGSIGDQLGEIPQPPLGLDRKRRIAGAPRPDHAPRPAARGGDDLPAVARPGQWPCGERRAQDPQPVAGGRR